MGRKEKAKNKALGLKGRGKQAIGKSIGNPDLVKDGKSDESRSAMNGLRDSLMDTAKKAKEVTETV